MTQPLIHLRTFAAGALFTLACWAGSSIASPTPLAAPSGPSAQQRITALTARLDRLQIRESQDRRTINDVALQTQEAADVTTCITTALYLTVDADTGAFREADQSEDGDYVPTMDPECFG